MTLSIWIEMQVTLLNYTPDPEQIIQEAYLSCRNLFDDVPIAMSRKTTENRIQRIFKTKHFGVLEHAIATFHITGISRSCTHQIVRHRISSYAHLSMRYVEPRDLDNIVPPSISDNLNALPIYLSTFAVCRKAYNQLRKLGIKKEDARFIIPMGIETEITISMNFRAWIHFLKLRTDKRAQWEIRNVAFAIWAILKQIAPNVFKEEYQQYWE